MSIPKRYLDELEQRVDLVGVISSRLPLKRVGKEYVACCPFHNDKNPSFTVSYQKRFYHCFGCGANGNAISFIMKHDDKNFITAVKELSVLIGLRLINE